MSDAMNESGGPERRPSGVRLSVLRLVQCRRPRLSGGRGRVRPRLAAEGVRLVYGGGGVGLMGAAATRRSRGWGRGAGCDSRASCRRVRWCSTTVETVVVRNMHERKRIMFEQSDAFAVLPGGIGTLEEVVELISWRRLDLHAKPIVFFNQDGFWEPFFALIEHTVVQSLTPAWLPDTWGVTDDVGELLPLIRRLAATALLDDGEVAAKA